MPGVEAPPNYSVWIELPGTTESRVPGTPLSRLYRSSGLVVRSRSARRVIDGLVSYLSAHADPQPGVLRSVSAALVGHGRAVLVPSWILGSLELVQPPLERAGWAFVDSFCVSIDPATGELVVPPDVVAVDDSVLAQFPTGDGRAVPSVPAGRYPIVRWALFPLPGPAPASTATALAAAMGTMVKDCLEPPDLLRGTALVLQRAAPRWVTSTDPKGIAREIIGIASDVRADDLAGREQKRPPFRA